MDGSGNGRTVDASEPSTETAGNSADIRDNGRYGRSQKEEDKPVPNNSNTTDEAEAKISQGRSLSPENGPYGGNGF